MLATDLSWPTYQAAVTQQALASDCQITTVPLRESIFHDGWTADDVTSFMARAYADNQCDGLFLPTVDNLGIRVPIRAIVERIRQTSQIPFVLVDAAQAFCHVSLDDSISVADFIVFGSHKWMKAGQPMGIGLFGNRSTQQLISNTLRQISETGSDLDPLMQFTEQLDGGSLNGHSETVNLTPLFSCGAVAAVHTKNAHCNEGTQNDDLDSAIHDIPTSLCHWRPILSHQTLRSGISLYARRTSTNQAISVEHTRREWLSHGCVVTAYPNGWVRVSLPVFSPEVISKNSHIADDHDVAGSVRGFRR
ncbi:MAG: aminotransferase class V-fold PLP-dependent enzyme [Planctomycetaceae bacterium]|nr:aminotransferase class V-fold PLP-dependent enzyme [Planctomycetaceae bacterium]